MSAQDELIRKQLAPIQVRKKLGRIERDIPYSFYSQLGTHPSVLSVWARTRVIEQEGSERPIAEILIAGTWQRDAASSTRASLRREGMEAYD